MFSLPLGLGKLKAEEKIIAFHSEILVQADSSLLVTETIKVRAEGNKIKRGIYRDFPIRYRDPEQGLYVVDFDLKEALRDGKPENYHLESQGDYQRIYLGSKEVFLKKDFYTYRLTYQTKGHLNYFKDHDELYWNVTGDLWEFKIAQASARVSLPQALDPGQIQNTAYTGKRGATQQDYRTWIGPSGGVYFETNQELDQQEGLTIVVGWPKGLVQPSEKKYLSYSIKEELFYSLAGLSLLLLYYALTWLKVGKDPQGGTRIPLFHPPQDYSPAALRFIKKMAFDDKSFAASLVHLAVQGFLTIKKTEHFVLEKKESLSQVASKEEKALLKALPSTLELSNKNHAIVSRAKESLEESLENQYGVGYFLRNTKFLVLGILLSFFVLAYAVLPAWSLTLVLEKISIFLSFLWLVFLSIVLLKLSTSTCQKWRQLFLIKGKSFVLLLKAIAYLILSLLTLGLLTLSFFALYTVSSLTITCLVAAIILVNISFYEWLKAPTLKGRQLLDQLEGFQLFLSVTEKERLALVHPPKITPALFEKYLPYALALEVEHAWSEQFASALADLSQEEQNYRPLWYRHTRYAYGFSGLASSLGTSLTSSVTAAAVAPRSSSASGFGGGSSGGGGGGGGGGGW